MHQRVMHSGKEVRVPATNAVRRDQLVIHSDKDVCDLAADAVRHALGNAANVSHEGNLAAGEVRIAEIERQGSTCNLLVIGASTPATRGASVGNSTRRHSLDLVARLKQADPGLAVVVLSTTPDEELHAFLGAYSDTAIVAFGPDWRDDLRRCIPQVVNGAAAVPAYLELDLLLEEPSRASWRLSVRGSKRFEAAGPLHVEASELNRIRDKSNDLSDQVELMPGDRWRKGLHDISVDLSRLLFESSRQNLQFYKHLVKSQAEVGGVQRTRVRVTLSEDTHPLLIEALKEEDDPLYWMLEAPIFRRYDHPGSRAPLFKDEASRAGPINVLVIEADPRAGSVNDGHWEGEFEALLHVRAETDAVVDVFRRATQAAGGGVVDRLSISDMHDDPVALMLAKLSERHWHVVHFAGHSIVSEARDGRAPEAGIVLFPENGGIVRIAELATRLVGTQFLFLSSCRSANAYFALRAIESMVPAVLGFRWSVSDASAARFAKVFYEALFDRTGRCFRFLEYAFMHARRVVHDRAPGDPTWASPLLVMQMAQGCPL